MTTYDDIIRAVKDKNVHLVRFLYADNGGIIRGKATHASKLSSRLYEGIGQTFAMQAFSGVETLASVEGLGPVGEFRLLPDPDTFTILPYAPHSAMLLSDMILPDGRPWEGSPRLFLKNIIARLAEHGLRAEAGVEHVVLPGTQRGDCWQADLCSG